MSREVKYGRIPCKFCGKSISTAGFAYVAHMRAHVRKGEAVERLDEFTWLREFDEVAKRL